MNKLLATLLLAASLTACADPKMVNGRMVQPYGLLDPETKQDDVEYKPSTGIVLWSLICIESVFVPFILVGYYLYEPVGPKQAGGK